MASEVTKRLRDRRLNVWEQCKALADLAATENRAFSAEEQGKWDVLNEEMDTLDIRIKAALDAEQRSHEADQAFNRLHADAEGKKMAKQPAVAALNDALRSFLLGETRGNVKGGGFEVSRPESSRINWNYGPINLAEMRKAEAEYRVLVSSASVSSAGNLVPTDFYDQLIAHLIEVSGILQTGPTVLNTAGGENLQIPKTASHSTVSAAGTQNQTLLTSDPSFGLITLGAYKYGILLQVARELLDDSGVDLVGYLAMQAGRALGNKFGSDLVTGTGSTMPTGLIATATTAVTGATGVGGVPRYQDLVNLEYSVIAPYRQSKSCYWMARDATIGGFRLILDGQSRPIWEPSMVLGSPDLLLGKPLVADPFMPAVATGGKSVAFGDFSQFFVRIVGPVRFERSDDFLFGSDLVAFRALIRGDGTLVDQTGAVKLYTGAAT